MLEAYTNVPLAFERHIDGTSEFLNYMPRRERCHHNDEPSDRIPADEIAEVCTNAAAMLRNLAVLIEAYGRGEIDSVRYPNKSLEQAILETNSDRARTRKHRSTSTDRPS